MLRDLGRTMKVVSRFGPELPQLVEDLLKRRQDPAPQPGPRRASRACLLLAGAVAALAGVGVGLMF